MSDQLSYFEMEGVGFCLQRYYVEDWVNNSMMFLEVADLDAAYRKIEAMQLPSKYPGVRLQPIQDDDWGREFFLHDPAGVLWHIGTFASDDSS
ncbi:MAG: glyoxalase [Planctomycetota bacterium]